MSEIMSESNAKSTVDRRTIVKGAAWSVPVIAAAIAAPAAAASAPSAVVAFLNLSSTSWPQLGNGAGNTVTGTGPTGFAVQNTPFAITGPITGTITIVPSASNTNVKGIGVLTINGATITLNRSVDSNGAGRANTTVTTFTYASGVASSELSSFTMTFGYEPNGKPTANATDQTFTASLVLKDSRGVQIGQPASVTLSTKFA